MKCTFYRPTDVNTKEFFSIIEKLDNDLHELEIGECDAPSVYEYIDTLCSLAKPLEHNPRMSFLGLWNPNEMDHDARVDFFYKPTYIATAIITKAILMYPELLKGGLPGKPELTPKKLRSALSSLMLGCTGRNFESGGVLPLSECLKIFERGGISEFIKLYPELCPPFNRLYKKRKEFSDAGNLDPREAWYM